MRQRRAELVAGVDEAGRGPLAGPVVVAAVILDPQRPVDGLADSKVLSEAQRETLAPLIRAQALAYAVIAVDIDEIERLNILGATLLGMTRTLQALAVAPSLALIDGNRLPKSLPCPARAIVGGDANEPAISAASILAKTERDRIMREFDPIHPGYGFAQHKGYPTPEHLACLERLGPCAIHRRGFAPVRRLIAPELL
ncbi:ribonuclease HII [Dokdonella sp.]|uniref:ribonuclease HII n=1 Tax=Dokdonella sp. TaxID=2291710 RepID=UPI001B12518C|nr:ribonuclease HII [Dokdonella sp.]MBO9662940.1 ribonuclease HII [Dokdonella sp.]